MVAEQGIVGVLAQIVKVIEEKDEYDVIDLRVLTTMLEKLHKHCTFRKITQKSFALRSLKNLGKLRCSHKKFA